MSKGKEIDFYKLQQELGNAPSDSVNVTATEDHVQCPYNFVPCPDHIVEVEDALRVTQDIPFRHGIGGQIEVEIEAHSPIFIPDPDHKENFFSLPDGQHAIPATSLRGMLRSVVEVATFGRMAPVNDHRFPLRDLTGWAAELYRRPMTMVSAGWLKQIPGQKYDGPDEDQSSRCHIEPTHWAKVGYPLLEKQFRGLRPGNPQPSMDKYKKFSGKDLDVTAVVKTLEDPTAQGKLRRLSSIGVVQELDGSKGTGEKGTVVFTGQPQRWDPKNTRSRAKRNDFFFHGNAGPAMPVSFAVRKAFSSAHGSSGEQHKLDLKPNPEWKHWQKILQAGGRVPVFFLADQDANVQAIGLARMFRLAGNLTVTAAAANAQGALDESSFDVAESIFGRVRKDDGLRGRIRIGMAHSQQQVSATAPVSVVMGGPKPSYYPFYLQQEGDDEPTTWLDEKGKAAGWKRYQVRETHHVPPLPEKLNEKMMTTFCPLEAGSRFRTTIHLHNLREHELGALIWALDYGQRQECFHSIGRGRPFGFGKVKLSIVASALRDVLGNSIADEALDRCRDAFRSWMEQRSGGDWGAWEKSPTIRELVATAISFPAIEQDRLNYMSAKEYQNAKNDRRTLAPASQRLAHAGVTLPTVSVVARPDEEAMTTAGPEIVRVTVPPSGAAAEYQEAWDSGGFKGVSELAHDWMTDSGSEETIERKKVIEKWTLGLSRQKKSKIQDIIDWCKE